MSFAKNSIEYILIVLVSLPGDFVVVSYQFCRVRMAHPAKNMIAAIF